jgi:hypothetical protein
MMKLFTEKQIGITAALAGPIPPGILIYKNYMAFGNERKAYITLASTLIFTVILFYAVFQLPSAIMDKIPNFAFTAFYGLIVYLIFKNTMAKDVEAALEEQAETKSNWAVAGWSVIGIIANLVIIFGFAVAEPLYEGKVVNINGNELYYDEDVPAKHVNNLGSKLVENDFFGANYGNIARLQRTDNGLLITLNVDQEFWEDPVFISSLTSLKWLMQVEFDATTRIQLEAFLLSGESAFKEI